MILRVSPLYNLAPFDRLPVLAYPDEVRLTVIELPVPAEVAKLYTVCALSVKEPLPVSLIAQL